MQGSSASKKTKMSPSIVVLVTGANSGIGLSFCKLFSKRQNHIVVGSCRELSKGDELKKLGCKVVELDISSDESCMQLPERLADEGITKIDILINNAGCSIRGNRLGSKTLAADALSIINVNAIGPLRVVDNTLPLLKKAASEGNHQTKIVNVSSRMGSIGDGPSGGSYGYRASKAALNMISATLAADLKNDNIWSIAVHPGHVSTKMGGANADIDPDSCAEQLTKLIDNAKEEDCARFLHRDGSTLPW